MSKSLIQVVNPSAQNVAENGIISLGSVARRFGCNLRLSGNAIEIEGEGYYKITSSITVEPTAIGNVTVEAFIDGSVLPAAVGSGYASTAATPVTVPIVGTLRKTCCAGASSLTFVLTEGAGSVTNLSARIEKA